MPTPNKYPGGLTPQSFTSIRILLLTITAFTTSHALVVPSSETTASTCNSMPHNINLNLDACELKQAVYSGRVFHQHNFLTESEVSSILSEIDTLQSSDDFLPSGLSDTNKGKKQQFGQKDRVVCAVPWWKSSLSNDSVSDESDGSSNEQRQRVSTKIQTLRTYLSKTLDRPSMSDESLAHECYYSKSTVGAYLNRHMDERHEETKGARGWLLPSRRSISWLVYLSDEDWDEERNGGALRSFPQKFLNATERGICGSHAGNLQVAWLIDESSKLTVPVYLDCWYPFRNLHSGEVEAHNILYMLRNENGETKVEFISRPWPGDSFAGSWSDFVKNQATVDEFTLTSSSLDGKVRTDTLFLRAEYARNFYLVEDRQEWSQGNPPRGSYADDISPKRGSLVLFDSVSVPHEVLMVKNGTRAAMAGWFHENTQPFPEGL